MKNFIQNKKWIVLYILLLSIQCVSVVHGFLIDFYTENTIIFYTDLFLLIYILFHFKIIINEQR